MTDENCYDKPMTGEDCRDKPIFHEYPRGKSRTDEDRKRIINNIVFAFAVIGGLYMEYVLLFKIMWPHLYIQQLHVLEDFNNSSNPNTSFVIDIEFKNPQVSDDLNITLYCASSYQSFSPIGHRVVPGFSEGIRTAHREEVVVPSGPSWDDARRKLAQGSTVELRVEMTTNYVYKKNAVVVAALRREKSAIALIVRSRRRRRWCRIFF
ncbi:hypothetical protein AAHA92_04077 [Salvia divinorum]|uniref:Late embryogenesis abundant protein LEA-2 subgroup domain-containing protein n=1 Tax=Salvia divinorum TaxID=28513 RepID=A0ABD1HY16_SALDI